jgi:hypothetical protein
MTKAHTPINELILQRKDLSRFPITRITEGSKCWQVQDLATGAVRQYKTKRAAQAAICAVVRQAMQ